MKALYLTKNKAENNWKNEEKNTLNENDYE
jgi:hypothetical protein